MNASVKLKTCKNKGCTVKFQQFNSIVVWCSPKCGQEIAEARVKANYKADTRKMTKHYRANNRSYQLRKAQDKCNEYIRLRDAGLPCISCGTTADVQYAAGHWKSIGSHPELRFHPFNIFLQCNRNCNLAKSGNSALFRNGIVERIGLKNVEWLEGPQQPQNLTLDDIKDINQHYKEQIVSLHG